MNPKEFVQILKHVVRDAAVQDVISILEKPPGRSPGQALIDRAEWYSTLDESSRRHLTDVVADTANATLFGLLCVLDGVRAIEADQIKGRLEIRYIKDKATILNDPDEVMLHNLL